LPDDPPSPCGRQQHLLAHDGGVALGDRIAAPLGERREAFQVARKNWKSCLRDPPLAHLALSCVSLAHMSKPVGPLCAPATSSPPSGRARKMHTVAIFLDEQTRLTAPGISRGPPDVRSNGRFQCKSQHQPAIAVTSATRMGAA